MSRAPNTLSAIVIARNEAHAIADCLQSVAWADEIIVLDSGSSDGTPEIARRYTPLVFETDWPGFGVQKNRALDKASGEWVLSLDADERVTPELADEILRTLPGCTISGYEIPFRSSYLGRFIKYGDWRDERHLRLFRRGAGHFTNDRVHERLLVEGRTECLNHRMLHHSFADLDEVLDKVNRYSREGACLRHELGRESSLGKAIGHGFWAFFKGYVLRAGFLDGREGFLLAVSNALGSFYRYAKLIYMNRSGDT